MEKTVAVFTGTRADYGHLFWVIKALQENKDINLKLYVGGMHLKSRFGNTYQQIINDGFKISEKMDYLNDSDEPDGISNSMANVIKVASKIFKKNKPDILVLLGDRYEALAMAQTAMIFCIPIAHIHGGERTEGAIDEAIRHSITKMSHLHFTATEIYKDRVIQLGENSSNVFNFGAPGIDNINRLRLLTYKELDKELNFKLGHKYLLVTYHPVTLDPKESIIAIEKVLNALDEFKDYKVVITYPNADTYGNKIIKSIMRYQSLNIERVLVVSSLGQLKYLSLMKSSSVVIGNSSSGIIEAPTFQIPTVNIGKRQMGRVQGDTILNANENKKDIINKVKIALSSDFKKKCLSSKNPYGQGEASEKIAEKISSHDLDNLIFKPFNDIEK